MKFFSSTAWSFLLQTPLTAQQQAFGTPGKLLHGGGGNLRSAPGISGGHLYIFCNDYGKRAEFNNNIKAYLKIYSHFFYHH